MGILRHLRNLLFGNGDSNNNEHRDIAPQQNDGQSATTQVTVELSPDRQARGDDTNARTQAVDTDDDATEASVDETTAATEQNHDSDVTPQASTSSGQQAPSHTDSTESEIKPEQDVVPSSEDVATDSPTADTIPDTDAEDSQQASDPQAASTRQSAKETSRPISDSATTSDAHETDTPNQPSVPTADFAELTAFQRDLLFIISGMETPKGLEIKEEVEGYYGEDINHGRLYPNLDTLAEEGLIEKVNLDGRSNGYNITDTGRTHLAARRTWVTTRLQHQTSTSSVGTTVPTPETESKEDDATYDANSDDAQDREQVTTDRSEKSTDSHSSDVIEQIVEEIEAIDDDRTESDE